MTAVGSGEARLMNVVRSGEGILINVLWRPDQAEEEEGGADE
jgi:hypothetical protein